MIIWCDKLELKIESDSAPLTTVLKPLPMDTEEERTSKKKYPYMNKRRVEFIVNYLGKTHKIIVPRGFRWNGTNCIGLQFYPGLLTASMVHDLMCNVHSIIGNDRQLSSIIFRELGIGSGVNHLFMWIAYYAVDIYQRFFGKDINGNRWK